MKFGVHVSIAGGISKAISRAKEISCDTFQIFTRNPRAWSVKPLSSEAIMEFKQGIEKSGLSPVFSHMPYLPNIASPEQGIWAKSIQSLETELLRCDALSIPFTIIHLGSSKSASHEEGLNRIITAIDSIFKKEEINCILLLENTAGKTKKLGSSLKDLYTIISRTKFPQKIGICFDTCHAFASGYDIRSLDTLKEILDEIESNIGLNKLKVLHCNDSVFELGSGRDRHEHIGLGKIGLNGFANLLKEKRLRNIPFICETPVDYRRGDKEELKVLRNLFTKIMTKESQANTS